MSLFDRIFGPRAKQKAQSGSVFQLLNGYTPVFQTFGGKLYEEELIVSAIEAKARHARKLKVEFHGAAQPSLIARLRDAPNSWQTWGQFHARLITILNVQNTAFIVPVLSPEGKSIGIATVLPSRCELREYNGTIWLRYEFSSGNVGAVEFDRCAIMVIHQYSNDIFGESNAALNPTMDLLAMQRQGITEAIKNGVSYRFSAEVSNLINDADIAKERERFTETNLRSGEGGLLLFPSTFKNVKQVNSTPYVVDDKQTAMIRTNVFDYFGVNDDIIQNKSFGDSYTAFYEGEIEPYATQFAEVLTHMLYTDRERAQGNRCVAATNRLIFMSAKDRLEFTSMCMDRGMAMVDTILEDVWGLPPLPNGLGQRIPIRGEYYNVGGNKNADTN